jgi:aminocarboxymuconate-semialdehyde decarboxylase
VGPSRGKRLVVDLHCHALCLDVERLVAGRSEKAAEPELQRRAQGEPSMTHNANVMLPRAMPKLTTVALRLRDMDVMGVDVQVLSPSPSQYYYWADEALAREVVRVQNEHIAALVDSHPRRLVGLGTVALQHPALAVEQLEHAVRHLGLRGIEVSSAVNQRELSDASLEPVWAKARELDCLLFLHPLGTSLGARLDRYYLSNTVGQPVETAVALSHLIFGGVLDRHPGLKICAAHGGGYLPYYLGRSNHAYRVRPEAGQPQRLPSEYLKGIWFDTVVHDPLVLRHLIDVVGASQVVVGTDYPFDMGAYDVQALVDAVPGLSEVERERILGLNAAGLLGLEPVET